MLSFILIILALIFILAFPKEIISILVLIAGSFANPLLGVLGGFICYLLLIALERIYFKNGH